ncbi:hypothetical protein Dsin_007668 [Dipteronia sinensis]|uniref:RNase H type-1 domain-containing protein n=1 Tax=Dipteronia sinensis TaxID=43782 RepID=A0AAE0B100_9ROSI|nr:hypothetical protein Dsin_007668 [Dipteronia sinensis]
MERKGKSCTIEYDGTSKGNPGRAGAGVVLRDDSGKVVNGEWRVKSHNLTPLYKEATELKGQFERFVMDHIPREYNSEADAQANRGVNLRDGQIENEYTYSNASEYYYSESEEDIESSASEYEICSDHDHLESEEDNESSASEYEIYSDYDYSEFEKDNESLASEYEVYSDYDCSEEDN